MLKRCIKTNLVLNYEKCHFMVDEGIILGHVVSSRGIEVDKSKIDVIRTLPYPIKFAGSLLFSWTCRVLSTIYQRFLKDNTAIMQASVEGYGV